MLTTEILEAPGDESDLSFDIATREYHYLQ